MQVIVGRKISIILLGITFMPTSKICIFYLDCLTETCSFRYGLNDLFPLKNVTFMLRSLWYLWLHPKWCKERMQIGSSRVNELITMGFIKKGGGAVPIMAYMRKLFSKVHYMFSGYRDTCIWRELMIIWIMDSK